MTEEEINMLTLNSFFLLASIKTSCIYLDKNCYCYLFQTRSAAESFISSAKAKGSIMIQSSKSFIMREFWDFYNQGAAGIRVFLRDKDKPTDISLLKDDVESRYVQFYNHTTNGILNRLQQTSQKQYLTALAAGMFFTPVKIEPRKKADYPYLHYSYATFKDATKYFLLFTTLQEYDAWNIEQDADWIPMEVTINKFNRIRRNNPVLINPLSNRLILTHQLLKAATQPLAQTV